MRLLRRKQFKIPFSHWWISFAVDPQWQDMELERKLKKYANKN